MLSPRRVAVLAWVQCVLVAFAAVCWLWSAMWHGTAVEAMSDEIIRMGLVDTVALPEAIQGYPSLGSFLQQGWDRSSALWGCALCLVGIGGSLVVAAMASIVAARPAQREEPRA